ncbi:hypothetical protein [Fodinibius saliphilus]|uniref:hypothetical protein n=1 Tax=Fodinibius saliphilus TaxID=1920650 RepID=UPI0014868F4E|nr:hypothetical protein [Fodinibius saliphilus]
MRKDFPQLISRQARETGPPNDIISNFLIPNGEERNTGIFVPGSISVSRNVFQVYSSVGFNSIFLLHDTLFALSLNTSKESDLWADLLIR